MTKIAGALCLLAIPGLIWLGITGVRHPEMNFWKHPIWLSPFARFGWGLGSAFCALFLALVGLDLLLD